MNPMNEHDEMNDDDRVDAVATALRQQSNAARISPSAALRQRTLTAIRGETNRGAQVRLSIARHSRFAEWGFSLAAAAVLALAIGATWVIVQRMSNTPDELGHFTRMPPADRALPGGGAAQPSWSFNTDVARLSDTATVRLASFTRPLEREAAALQSDFKRISNRMRSAIPNVVNLPAPSQPSAAPVSPKSK
jgi:hypothetical protein